jgi:hypothetical protein
MIRQQIRQQKYGVIEAKKQLNSATTNQQIRQQKRGFINQQNISIKGIIYG